MAKVYGQLLLWGASLRFRCTPGVAYVRLFFLGAQPPSHGRQIYRRQWAVDFGGGNQMVAAIWGKSRQTGECGEKR